MTNPTMRIVWFRGKAFAVTAHPQGLNDPGTHWHVQTEEGEWHPVLERDRTGEDRETWPRAREAIVEWLTLRSDAQPPPPHPRLTPRVFIDLAGRTVTHYVRQFTINGEPWTVYEDRSTYGGPTLVFETDRAARRVRVYPGNWPDLADDELYALSWSR